MKKYSQPFSLAIEARSLGASVVCLRFVPSMSFAREDAEFVSSRVMLDLLPQGLTLHPLDDGSFIVVRDPDGCACLELTPRMCIPANGDSVIEFSALLELPDGSIRDTRFSLNRSLASRHDYFVGSVLCVVLRGTISVEVDDEQVE